MTKTRYANKYKRKKPTKSAEISNTEEKIQTQEPMAKQSQPTENNNNNNSGEETHENFIKNMKPEPHESPTLEDASAIMNDPLLAPKVERDYTTSGIASGSGNEPPSGGNGGATPPPPEEGDDFNPTPPDPNDAPQQEPPSPEDPASSPFQLPTGNAEELIDMGAKMLNYFIDQYGDLAVGVKIHKDFYSIPDAVDKIKDQNKRNVESIKLNPTEVAMLKKPLVKLMQEKGIRGLTPGEELLLVCAIIVTGKVKVIIQIRKENKDLKDILVAEIRSMRKHNQQFDEQNSATSKGPIVKDDVETVDGQDEETEQY